VRVIVGSGDRPPRGDEGAATWWFVRHGESEANAGGWFSGHRDVALTSRGIEQAMALREALVGLRPARLLASDLRRAWHTAELAWPSFEPPLERVPALRERDLGEWTGIPLATLRERGDFERLYSWEGVPPGGESQRLVARRALTWLAAEGGDADTLLFGHGALLRGLVGLLDGTPTALIGTWTAGNAELIERRVPRGRWAELLALV
jgi:broad specificity phosphatase PhoE